MSQGVELGGTSISQLPEGQPVVTAVANEV